MTQRPEVVAFDAMGTLFLLAPLGPRLEAAGLSASILPRFAAEILRDGIALSASGGYAPFRDVAEATLRRLLTEAGAEAEPDRVEAVLDGFSELDAAEDAARALRALREAGLRTAILTNGSAKATKALVDRNGLVDLIERIVSVDEPRRWKPVAVPYHHAAQALGVAPERLGLVAAHAWDVQGARRAGLVTAYVARVPFPAVMEPPHVEGETLMKAAEALASLPKG